MEENEVMIFSGKCVELESIILNGEYRHRNRNIKCSLLFVLSGFEPVDMSL